MGVEEGAVLIEIALPVEAHGVPRRLRGDEVLYVERATSELQGTDQNKSMPPGLFSIWGRP
jgi:hypothetical protein